MLHTPEILILILQRMPRGLTYAERCEYLERHGVEFPMKFLMPIPRRHGNPERCGPANSRSLGRSKGGI